MMGGMTMPGWINLRTAESAHTVYHEYGHFLEDDGPGLPYTYDGPSFHVFTTIGTHNAAWSEGFAEFVNAAFQMYWYAKEQPEEAEHNDGRRPKGLVPVSMEFLDYSQQFIPSEGDLTKNEGLLRVSFTAYGTALSFALLAMMETTTI